MKPSAQKELTVLLEELSCSCIIGELPEERIEEQLIYLQIAYRPKSLDCLESDRLEETIDYRKVAETSRQICKEGGYHLLETLAHTILKTLFAQFPILWARVKVTKPNPLKWVKASSVEVSAENSFP